MLRPRLLALSHVLILFPIFFANVVRFEQVKWGQGKTGDSTKRSLAKAVLWRAFAATNTLICGVFLAKDLSVAYKIAGTDTIFKTVSFFVLCFWCYWKEAFTGLFFRGGGGGRGVLLHRCHRRCRVAVDVACGLLAAYDIGADANFIVVSASCAALWYHGITAIEDVRQKNKYVLIRDGVGLEGRLFARRSNRLHGGSK